MLPPGHLAVSYLIGKLSRTQLRIALIAGTLPDIDFLLLPLPVFNQIHRVITHNLAFILLSSGLISQHLCPPQQRRRGLITATASGLSHLLIDACLDANPSNGIGVAWLWPLSRQTYSPVNLLTPTTGTISWHQPLSMVRPALQGLVWEIPFYLLAFAVLRWSRHKNNSTSNATD